ncbi:MAG: arylesterase [SAR324 cluster bacterium]|nr:arylesterase [SAR324 cluster bacterium]
MGAQFLGRSKIFIYILGLLWLISVVSVPISIHASTNIIFLGDSLTEGLGVKVKDSYPYVASDILKSKGLTNLKIIVDGISGSTSISGFSRLKRNIKQGVIADYLFLALGANDGLRGLPNKVLYGNLDKIINLSLKNNIKVIIVGMQVPTNYGIEYSQEFSEVYKDLYKKYRSTNKVFLLNFLLEGVAQNPHLNQTDGIHPNTKGHSVIANNVSDFLAKIIK